MRRPGWRPLGLTVALAVCTLSLTTRLKSQDLAYVRKDAWPDVLEVKITNTASRRNLRVVSTDRYVPKGTVLHVVGVPSKPGGTYTWKSLNSRTAKILASRKDKCVVSYCGCGIAVIQLIYKLGDETVVDFRETSVWDLGPIHVAFDEKRHAKEYREALSYLMQPDRKEERRAIIRNAIGPERSADMTYRDLVGKLIVDGGDVFLEDLLAAWVLLGTDEGLGTYGSGIPPALSVLKRFTNKRTSPQSIQETKRTIIRLLRIAKAPTIWARACLWALEKENLESVRACLASPFPMDNKGSEDIAKDKLVQQAIIKGLSYPDSYARFRFLSMASKLPPHIARPAIEHAATSDGDKLVRKKAALCLSALESSRNLEQILGERSGLPLPWEEVSPEDISEARRRLLALSRGTRSVSRRGRDNTVKDVTYELREGGIYPSLGNRPAIYNLLVLGRAALPPIAERLRSPEVSTGERIALIYILQRVSAGKDFGPLVKAFGDSYRKASAGAKPRVCDVYESVLEGLGSKAQANRLLREITGLSLESFKRKLNRPGLRLFTVTDSSVEIPRSIYVFDEKEALWRGEAPKTWKEAMKLWRSTAMVAAEHTKGDCGGGPTAFAQSFVPHCDVIRAVAVCAYPIQAGSGWLRTDIVEDDGGVPGKSILARSWLRVERDCPVTHGEYLVFDVPDISVHPKKTYWITFAEFQDKGSSGGITNVGSSNDNTYSEGRLLPPPDYLMREGDDVKFRIISECGRVPMLRRATTEDGKTFPSGRYENIDWREETYEWSPPNSQQKAK